MDSSGLVFEVSVETLGLLERKIEKLDGVDFSSLKRVKETKQISWKTLRTFRPAFSAEEFIQVVRSCQPVCSNVKSAPDKSPEALKKLDEATRKYNELVYKDMVRDVAPPDNVEDWESDAKQIRAQLGMGLNVIVGMFTGFAAGYYVARGYGNVKAVMCGCLCMTVVMLAEVALYAIRASRSDTHAARKTKKEKKIIMTAHPAMITNAASKEDIQEQEQKPPART